MLRDPKENARICRGCELRLASKPIVRLSDIAAGTTVRLHRADLDAPSRARLRALGLIDASRFRVCLQGEPCVIAVRTTRIGITARVAKQLFVIECAEEDEWR